MRSSRLLASLDIGSSKIATLVAQFFPQEERLNIIGVAATPSGGIRKGQIIDIEEATAAIEESVEAAERMAGVGIREAVVGITAPQIHSLSSNGVVAIGEPEGEVTPVDVERVLEAAQAVSLPANRRILHVVPREFKVDGEGGIVTPVGMSGVRLEVEAHIITGSEPILRNIEKCLVLAGVSPLGLVYNGIAAGEAVLTKTEKELGVVLVDIGGGTTSVTIFLEGTPCWVSVLPVGGLNVTNDLAIGLRLPLEVAERLKLNLGKVAEQQEEIELAKLGVKEAGERKISPQTVVEGIIRPRLEEIFSLVKKAIKDSGFGGKTPAGLVLTGGGAHTVGVEEVAGVVVGLPVRIGRPKEIGGLGEEIADPKFAVGIGLLRWGLKQVKEARGRGLRLTEVATKMQFKGLIGKIRETLESLLP